MKLVLLRGLLREQRHWLQVPYLIRQNYPDLEVLTPDLAGNGRRFKEISPASISAMVDDLRSKLALDQVLMPEPIILVAISLGGMIACQWCFDYPDEVAGLVLINTSFRCFSPLRKRLAPKWYGPIAKLLIGRTDAQQKEAFILHLTSNQKAQDKELLFRFTQIASECPIQKINLLRQLWAAACYQGELKPPLENCLILSGLRDQMVSPECSQAIAQAWGCELKTESQAGHDLSLDAPEWLVEQLAPVIECALSKVS